MVRCVRVALSTVMFQIVSLCAVFCAAASPSGPEADGPGSESWIYDVSKSVAVALSETTAWHMSIPYLRDLAGVTQDWNVLMLAARVELLDGNTQAARRDIGLALKFNGDNPRLLMMAGQIEADDGNYAEAARYLRKSIEIQPANTDAYTALSRAMFSMSDWDGVIGTHNLMIRNLGPSAITTSADMLVRLSTAYERTGDLVYAERLLLQNVDANPNRTVALMALERFYRRTNAPYSKLKPVQDELTSIQAQSGVNTAQRRPLQKSSR